MQGRRVLLIVGGGIAAYKTPELIRLLSGEGVRVTTVLTEGGAQFVTPLTLASLSGEACYTALWDLTREAEMGHIQLSRAADLVVVAPATADLMAKMAAGLAGDLASTLLMATDKPVLIAPAMNVRMWEHPATRRNLETLRGDGILTVGPDVGAMACGEWGEGRMAEPAAIVAAIREALGGGAAGPGSGGGLAEETGRGAEAPLRLTDAILRLTPDSAVRAAAGAAGRGETEAALAGWGEGAPLDVGRLDTETSGTANGSGLAADGSAATRAVGPVQAQPAAASPTGTTDPGAALPAPGPLEGRHVIVTSGPTHEPIDPVRYIANRSSGAQGTAIAAALRDLGARVSFVTGPAEVQPPEGVEVIAVETAREMRDAVEGALPADAAVMAAAVADWRVVNAADRKLKKDGSGRPPALEMAENPDILAWISRSDRRPALVVGFAAETDDVVVNATAKRARKGCDWIVANDVRPATGIMGGAENAVVLVTADGAEPWPRLPKTEVARRLAGRIAAALGEGAAAPDEAP
ncbi:bifunctional phosphopantothenoylcysteine decarboxylase/phosphopantothenate synthase [Paracoccus panacisoli]|uniref:Coenzyme A biosynthesis bifunctional protein CoaBC n=1 Tax=Paracoccus panacisoli TaxID=1510163 RepID=A0ABV6TA47_9RHOB